MTWRCGAVRRSLIGNRGYRRFLKLSAGRRFEIDLAPRRARRALRWHLRAAHQHQIDHRCRPSSATATAGWSRTSSAHRKVAACHPPDLSQGRPDHPRPHLLLLSSRWCCARNWRIGWRRAGTHPRMGRHRARSATVERNRDRARRQALRLAQHRPRRRQHRPAHARRCFATPGPLRAAAACHTTTPKTPPKTPTP